MAITGDFTGLVPTGTPHYSGFQNPAMTYLGSIGSWSDSADSLIDMVDDLIALAVTAIVVYEMATNIKPHTPPWELMPHPDQYLFPESQDGRGMWTGPGVVYYAL